MICISPVALYTLLMDYKSDKALQVLEMLKAGKRYRDIKEVIGKIGNETIQKIQSHYQLAPQPTGPRSSPDVGMAEGRTLCKTGLCACCLLPTSYALYIGDANNQAYCQVCEACAAGYRIFDPSTSIGRRRLDSLVSQWENLLRPQIAALSPIVSGDRFWRDSGGYKQSSYCYEDAPDRQFKDEAGKIPFPMNDPSEVDFDAPDYIEPNKRIR